MGNLILREEQRSEERSSASLITQDSATTFLARTNYSFKENRRTEFQPVSFNVPKKGRVTIPKLTRSSREDTIPRNGVAQKLEDSPYRPRGFLS